MSSARPEGADPGDDLGTTSRSPAREEPAVDVPHAGEHHDDDPHYDDAYYRRNGQDGDRPALLWYARLARRYLGSGPVLDVGCGTGFLLRRLAQQGPADGLEVSQYSARTARQTSPTSRVYTAGADLPPDRYDRFVAIHVVEHLDDSVLATLLAELRRAARPGARYLIVTPDAGGDAQRRHGAAWNAYTDPTHVNLKTHAQWRQTFTGHGFTILREGSDGLWNFPYSRLPRLVDAARHGLPMAAQFLSGRVFLRPGTGESSVFVLG